MGPFDIRHFLNDPELSEEILIDSVPTMALVKRMDQTSTSIKSVNNQSYFYPIEIEVCSIIENPDGTTTPFIPVEGRTNGTMVSVTDIKGNLVDLRVSKIIRKDNLANSYRLGLA
jgi:hypothetical protein